MPILMSGCNQCISLSHENRVVPQFCSSSTVCREKNTAMQRHDDAFLPDAHDAVQCDPTTDFNPRTPCPHIAKQKKAYSPSKEFSSASTLAFVAIFFICVSSSFSPPARRISRSSMARTFFCRPRSFLAFGLPPVGDVMERSGTGSGVRAWAGLIVRLCMFPVGGPLKPGGGPFWRA